MRTIGKVFGAILVILSLIILGGCVALISHDYTNPPTVTPSPVARVSVAPVHAKAPASPTRQETLPTPQPTIAPSDESSPRLSEPQLQLFESNMEDAGFTVTEHLRYDHTTADGAIVYGGELAKDGITYTYALSSCKDAAGADTVMSASVLTLQALGFHGSYKNTDTTNTWIGTRTNDNGAVVGGMATEAMAEPNTPPYTVMTAIATS